MATLKQIRQRIKTARNIQQITRAMKLVAAARLRKATERVFEARPYSEKLRDLMLSLSSAGELPSHPLMENRPVRRLGLILITAERGLAGSYNTNLLRTSWDFLKAQTVESCLVTVGKKGTTFLGKRGYRIAHSVTVPSAGARLEDAIEVTRVARAMYESGEVDAVFICYSKFYSPIRQVPQIVKLLPIEAPRVEESQASVAGTSYLFEPDPAQLLDTLLPRYFQGLIWQAMLEATASEHGARMSAMTSATDNAGKMIDSLTLRANRERQSIITTQILEVVSGAEALKA